MRPIYPVALMFLSIQLSLQAQASDAGASLTAFYASQFLARLTQVKSAKDVAAAFPLKKSDAELVRIYLKQHSLTNLPSFKVNLEKNSRAHIEIEKKSVVLDFKDIAQNKIYLNNIPINISENMTFLNYNSATENILHQKKFSFWSLFEELTRAQSANNPFSFVLATGVTFVAEHKTATQEPIKSIQDAWLAFYDAEAKAAEEVPGSKYFNPIIFSCSAGSLQEISRNVIASGGLVQNLAGDGKHFVANPAENLTLGMQADYPDTKKMVPVYRFTTPNCGLGSFTLDRSLTDYSKSADFVGQVSERDNRSCSVTQGDWFASEGYFFAMPALAKQCCQQKGCYEAVSDKLLQLAKHFGPMDPNDTRILFPNGLKQ